MSHDTHSRRRVLTAVSGIAATALAGCSTNDSTDPAADSPEPTPEPTPEPPDEIVLVVEDEYPGSWRLEYAFEGARGEEYDTMVSSVDAEVPIPSHASYVEAKVTVNSKDSMTASGSLGLKLVVGSTVVDSCESVRGPDPSCYVDGITEDR